MRLAIPRAALCAAACSLALVSTLPATPRAASAVPAVEMTARVTDVGAAPCRTLRPVAAATATATPVPLLRGATSSPSQVRVDPATRAAFVYWAARDGGLRVTTKTGELDVRKTVYLDGRFEIVLEAGQDRLSVAMGPHSVDVARGGTRAHVEIGRDEDDDWLRVKQVLAGSKALRLFRALTAALDPATLETVAGTAMLSGDAVLGYLDGDVGAIPRLAEHFIKQRRAKLKPAAFEDESDAAEKTCYKKYEEEVAEAAREYHECRRTFEWWSGWQAACVARWALQAESAWFQFIACSAVPLRLD
jgi:hypothetical protein